MLPLVFNGISCGKIQILIPKGRRTHDVDDDQGLTLDRSFAVIRDLVENKRGEESTLGGMRALQPTMCMKRNGVRRVTRISSSCYVIDGKAGSYLASQREVRRSHDIDHSKGFKPAPAPRTIAPRLRNL
jgi:hypothetical protein